MKSGVKSKWSQATSVITKPRLETQLEKSKNDLGIPKLKTDIDELMSDVEGLHDLIEGLKTLKSYEEAIKNNGTIEEFEGKTYVVFNQRHTHFNAQNLCRTFGRELLTIDNANE